MGTEAKPRGQDAVDGGAVIYPRANTVEGSTCIQRRGKHTSDRTGVFVTTPTTT